MWPTAPAGRCPPRARCSGSKAQDYCNPNDPICHAGQGNEWSGHTEGYVPVYTTQAAAFVAPKLLGGSSQQGPGYSPPVQGFGPQAPGYGPQTPGNSASTPGTDPGQDRRSRRSTAPHRLRRRPHPFRRPPNPRRPRPMRDWSARFSDRGDISHNTATAAATR